MKRRWSLLVPLVIAAAAFWPAHRVIEAAEGAPNIVYILADDMGEQRTVAGEHPDRVRAMREAIRVWQADVARGATVQPDSP